MMRKIALVSFGLALAGIAAPATAEVVNRRGVCDPWENVPASEALGSPPAALLFCNEEDGDKWLALAITCRLDPVRMRIEYRPGFAFEPPKQTEPEPVVHASEEDAEEAAAADLIAQIPYEDSGIKVLNKADLGAGREMVFLDFKSFGYTGVATWESNRWTFVENEPLSPMFSRLMTGNYADIKLLAYGKTERFPLRGSRKALSPVVEACRIAKRDADRANN